VTRFRRLDAAPDRTLREEWNRLVQAVEQLLRLSAGPPLEVSWLAGSPALRWAGPLVRATERARLLEDLFVGGTAQACLRKWTPDGWEDGTEITVTDWGLDFAVPAGRNVIVDFHAGSGQWHLLQSQFVPLTVVTQLCCADDETVVCDAQIRLNARFERDACPCPAAATETEEAEPPAGAKVSDDAGPENLSADQAGAVGAWQAED